MYIKSRRDIGWDHNIAAVLEQLAADWGQTVVD